MERRSLLDEDATSTQQTVDVFSDDYEVEEEDFDGIADGFRPGQSHDREGRSDDDLLIRPASIEYAPGTVTSARPSRNSTRKSRSHDNPFASPEDEATAPLERTPSGNFAAIARRSISSASSHQFAGTNSPRFGTSGPSHPYGMYPQGTMARTPSVATTSTARPSRQSMTRDAPQHPYALYPQGVGDEVDDEEGETSNPVPVGFLGLGRSYERRRGPDGEEQDIVGHYGHAEQLPPYTRYPEDAPEKAPLMGVPIPPSALHSRAPVAGTDPSMALMHTQISPAQQQSMTDGSNLQRQNTTMSRASGSPLVGVSSSESSFGKKSWSEKSWSEKRKTQVCGIPLWWYMSAVGLICFIGVVVGGVIGGYVEGHSQGEKHAVVTVVSTSLYDASLITTATGTPLPTGTFSLTLGLPQETQAACLDDPHQQHAWSCELAGNTEVWLNIANPPDSNTTGAFLYTVGGNGGQLAYGAQMSSMSTTFSPFLYVTDMDDPAYGPAFYFQQQYNKLVVVPEDQIDVAASKIKREAYQLPPAFQMQQGFATPGAKPWFCYWNDTFVEGFVYASKRAIQSTSTTSSSSPSMTAMKTTGPPPPPPTSQRYGPPSITPWSITWAHPSDIVSTTIPMATTTCTYTGAASGFPSWMHDNYPDWHGSRKHHGDGDDDDDDGGSGGSSAHANSKRHVGYIRASERRADELFDYLVKIEERRLPNSAAPICVQNQVLDNYVVNVVTNPSDGTPITITLDESDPAFSDYKHSNVAASRKLRRRRDAPKGCHCQWTNAQ